MRPLALIFLLASCAAVRAQVQERKMLDRILEPDRTLASPLQEKAYYGGGAGGTDLSKEATVKDFNFIQKFFAKEFNAKQFNATSYWTGDFQFVTKQANIKDSAATDKVFASKSLPVKDARESGKSFGADSAYATRESPMRGKTSQNHLEEVNKGPSQGQMNIDAVRDLLNKPKL
jgi:hypothetical protein